MEITLPTLIDLFSATKQTEGNSNRTIEWYKAKLTHFADFLKNGEEARLTDVTLDTARSFIASLQARKCRFYDHPYRPTEEGGLSPFTIHGYVRTLKVFSTWLVEEGFTSKPLFARLKRPKLGKPMIQILSHQEINSIVNAINPNSFLGGRMYAIVLLLLDTGIRASECCNLTLGNTHMDEGYIKVLGKGSKERIAPFGGTTKKALIRYTTAWRPEPEHDLIDSFFLSPQGKPLTYSGLSQALKRLGRRTGVPRLRAHLFRHTFAVRYLMNGGDVMTLRLILGHSTLDVTQMYMHLAEAHVRIQHHKFSPVAPRHKKQKIRAKTTEALAFGPQHARMQVVGPQGGSEAQSAVSSMVDGCLAV